MLQSKKYRSQITKIHVTIASFVFPIGLMFLVTGGLYILGYEGGAEKQHYHITLTKSIVTPDLPDILTITENRLKKLKIPQPLFEDVEFTIVDQTGFILSWKDLHSAIEVKTITPNRLELTISKNNFYKQLLQLHKNKGTWLFRVYAILWVVFLLTTFLLGFLLAWQLPKLRKVSISASIIGWILFSMMVYFQL